MNIYTAVLYTGINCFIAGYYLAQNWKWADTPRSKIKVSLNTLGIALAGILIAIVVFPFAMLDLLWDWLNNNLQARFWLEFIFTQKWNNLEKSKLYYLNKGIEKYHKHGKKLQSRVFIYTLKKVNERNQYTYIPDPKL